MREIQVARKIGWAFATETLVPLLPSPATRENEGFAPLAAQLCGQPGAWEEEWAYPVWMPALLCLLRKLVRRLLLGHPLTLLTFIKLASVGHRTSIKQVLYK